VHEIGNRTYLVADVEPLAVTGLRTVSVGTALFLLAGLALLPFYGWLEDHDREWWLWTCAAGFGLGLFGYDHCRRRARHLARPEGEVTPGR
jgi:drug/metabolite transporter (DMT)-like permease